MTRRSIHGAARAALLPALLFLAGGSREAQGQGYVPYYGRNKVKYDQFDWRVYKSPHFEIYYYPEFEQHLARITSYLESAYEKLSAGLKHEISRPIPAILYKTWTEFEQTNLNPGFLPEGVLAFAEPGRGRLTLPIDRPPDLLNGLIQHEMTHIFAFDIIPRSENNVGRVSLWIDEGFAEYMTGVWDPTHLQQMRELVLADRVPKMFALTGSVDGQPHVAAANLGHAVFEFIEAEYGKPAIWQFLLEVRRSVVDGAADPYQAAFNRSPEELDSAFASYLRRRFGP